MCRENIDQVARRNDIIRDGRMGGGGSRSMKMRGGNERMKTKGWESSVVGRSRIGKQYIRGERGENFESTGTTRYTKGGYNSI